jgi:hypothetical protein
MNKYFPFLIIIFLILVIPLFLFFAGQTKKYFSKASQIKANISIDAKRIVGPLPYNWKALAQGGEEQGVRMLENVIHPVSALYPRYIRIDHIYDFYNVVSLNKNDDLILNWDLLDATVCDIYRTGAKPFFSLGYMPSVLSSDGSLVSPPKDWGKWAFLVQKTIERYSGKSTRICGQITGEFLKDVYYEVWNEPDLETFGKWSLYGGFRDYKLLYFYSSQGASRAQDVYSFFLGGPSTTAAYKNWFQTFLRFVNTNNLRIDFLSWHHYSKNPEDFSDDLININHWLSDSEFYPYNKLPKIISEWGYDSHPNIISETNIGAAHTIASIRNLIEQKLEMAFAFEIKDGPNPSWGILSYSGEKKPRYQALKLLNFLERYNLQVKGEGTFVKAIASGWQKKLAVILVNYDEENKNTEIVPLEINNLLLGKYLISHLDLNGEIAKSETVITNKIQSNIFMPSNSVIAILVEKTED